MLPACRRSSSMLRAKLEACPPSRARSLTSELNTPKRLCKQCLNLFPLATRARAYSYMDRHRMASLDKETKLRLLKTILESRHADLREQNLNRQGKGHFHVSGMGHEALAAVSIQMEPGDYIVSYYRDRGLVLGRGMTTRPR